MASNYDDTVILPTYTKHELLLDTCVPVTQFDPRLGGYIREEDGSYTPVDPRDPSFEGELVAYILEGTKIRELSMLVGHDADDSQGLRWITVQSNTLRSGVKLDTRTGGVFDPYWPENCNPPWLCE